MPDPFDPTSYDPTKKQQQLLDKADLWAQLDKEGKVAGNRAKLLKSGLTDEQIDALLGGGYGDSADALARMSRGGALAGRRAAGYSIELGLQDLDKAAGLSEQSAREDIAYSTGALSDRLRAAIGPGVDPNSPALLQLQQQHQFSRETALESALRNIQTDLAYSKAAVKSGQLASLYMDIGDTVEALREIREQEKDLRGASIGNIVGALTFNPWIGAGVGAAFGGTPGAMGGVTGGYQGLNLGISAISALSGGGAGTPAIPGVQAPQGAIASNMDTFFPA